jgi:hypothetical protein
MRFMEPERSRMTARWRRFAFGKAGLVAGCVQAAWAVFGELDEGEVWSDRRAVMRAS